MQILEKKFNKESPCYSLSVCLSVSLSDTHLTYYTINEIRGHPQITSHLGGREEVLQVVTWCDKVEGGGSPMCDITFLWNRQYLKYKWYWKCYRLCQENYGKTEPKFKYLRKEENLVIFFQKMNVLKVELLSKGGFLSLIYWRLLGEGVTDLWRIIRGGGK